MAKKKMQTLLETAKLARGNRSKYTKEEVELALAWVRGEVGVTQVAIALKQKLGSQTYSFLALALKHYMQEQENGSAR